MVGSGQASIRQLGCLLAFLAAEAAGGEPIELATREQGGVTAVRGEPLELAAVFPGETSLTLHTAVSNWVTLDRLDVRLQLDSAAPAGVQLLAHVIDWDGLWYQRLLPDSLGPGEDRTVSIDVSARAGGWEAQDHHGAWHRRALMEPREVGLRVFHNDAVHTGVVTVVSAVGIPSADSAPPFIRHVRANSTTVPVHGRYELRFEIPDRHANPFDPREVAVDAEIETPGGRQVAMPCFYHQEFFRTVSAAGETLLPQGRPEWRLRYSPTEPGEHVVRLRVQDRHGEGRWGPASFFAAESGHPGRVRVSEKDPRFFEFQDGTPYFPVGHNIRSPFDVRMDTQFPWRFRHPEGSAAYHRYFRDMAAAGSNIVEIWAAAWSLGLEWSTTHRGYHGIGQYNLHHAWELDQVFRSAGEGGLQVNLVLNNHGRLSAFVDPEWDDNPFNVARGGYLSRPLEWFWDERAILEFKHQMRYFVARYAWNANLFAWELWSELDLTGSTHSDRPHYDRRVVEWHRRIARHIREIDPYEPMITTHYSHDYRRQNPEITALPEMSLAAVDAYHNSNDPLEIARLVAATAQFNNPFAKPVMVTEFGGSPMAASLGHLRLEVHAGLWSSATTAVAGTPLFWWWQVIEEENFYPMYTAIARFMEGEDRRDPELLPAALRVLGADGRPVGASRLGGYLLASPRQSFGWLHAAAPMFSTLDPDAPPGFLGLNLRLGGEEGRIYRVEFWDTRRGRPVERPTDHRVRGGTFDVDIPPFARDIAFKVKARTDDAP